MWIARPLPLALGALITLGACTPRYAQTAEDPGIAGSTSLGGSGGAGAGAGSGAAGVGATGGGTVACPPDLKDRITLTEIAVDEDIRYKRAAYDWAPMDNRIALSLSSNGGYVAWVNNALTKVHVTPLGPDLMRSGPDVVVDGADVGGLVAHDDGFALLLRRTDPGEPLVEESMGTVATAAVLVRYEGGAESFSAPLTGTAQIDSAQATELKRDCAPRPFQGRLAYDPSNSRYGAYFFVAACEGHPLGTTPDGTPATHYGDKLIYVDGTGAYVSGGGPWHCGASKDLRLLPEASAFLALCMSDLSPEPAYTQTPNQTGLNLVVEGSKPVLLADEFAEHGYNGSPFGSVVKLSDGYFVGWLSRGKNPGTAPADPAFLRLGLDRAVTAPFKKLFATAKPAEMNLHFAPYGPGRLLMVWDSIDEPSSCDPHNCLGDYSGTHLRLIDTAGTFVTEDLVYDAPPNTEDDIVVFPNGDLGWAFVPETTRNYKTKYPPSQYAPPPAPAQRRIRIARVRNCQ